MKNKAFIILIASLLLLCACQPTPEQEFVVNKADGKMEEAIFNQKPEASESEAAQSDAEQETENEPLIFPERWTEDLSTQYMNLKIDAEIDLGDMMLLPVYGISNTDFSAERKESILRVLFPELDSGYKGIHRTKEEIEEMIGYALRGAEKRTQSGEIEYVSWAMQDNWLSDLKKQYQGAVAENEQYASLQISDLANQKAEYTVRQRNGAKGSVFSGKKNGAVIYEANNSGLNTIIQRQSWEIREIWDESEKSVFIHPAVTQEYAQNAAIRFFEEIGEEMPTFIFAEPARVYSDYELGVISEGYYMRFRQNGGYPVVYYPEYTVMGGMLSINDSVMYQSPWNMETIELYADETGVRWVKWINPVQIGECINENVQILPFEEIQQHIRNLLRAGMRNVHEISATGYRMTGMYLTAYPISLLNENRYVLAPVWYLSFEVYVFNPYTGVMYADYLNPSLRMAILMNAIDGSVVSVTDGYFD